MVPTPNDETRKRNTPLAERRSGSELAPNRNGVQAAKIPTGTRSNLFTGLGVMKTRVELINCKISRSLPISNSISNAQLWESEKMQSQLFSELL